MQARKKMKKIMFNDRYGLTEAVLNGRKTQTRRIVSDKLWDEWYDYDDYCNNVGISGLAEIGIIVTREYYDEKKFFLDNTPYKVGEVIAIAQSYKDAVVNSIPCEDEEFGCYGFHAEQTHGWSNKMFVRADLMPHHIRITNVRVERLQDISDDDCIKEGIVKRYDCGGVPYYKLNPNDDGSVTYRTPQEAYAALIDKISGKGTWESNPHVFVYDFELTDKLKQHE